MTKLNFQKLTPEDELNIEVYYEALEFIFDDDNKDIRNIAITGSYGSGKSSLIKSYEKKYGPKFANISLTHFRTSDMSNLNDEKKYVTDDVIEEKIINQLIQQLDVKSIKKSIFKVKTDNYKNCSLNLHAIGIAICFVGMIMFLNKNIIGDISWWFSLVALASSLSGTLCWLFELQENKNILKKININGNEIELESNDKSYFDKYINEILYLLEKNKYNNIVFEDIDRFNNFGVFEQLREINKLVNLRLNKNGRVIRFFYLIRDDLLEEKEKTKFFDFEIPIIPVINNSNSFNKLKEWIDDGDNAFDLKFLRNICLYIDDMRLLKNIYNDFLIYKNRLSDDIDLDNDKLFAMMVYKNIFPKDFSELQFKRGLVHELLVNKYESSYIKNKQTEIENKSKSGQLNKEDIEHEKDRVKNVTLSEILAEKGGDEYAKKYIEKGKYIYIKDSYYCDLLKYLLREGKIDENHSDYISYFYSNVITNTDKKFLRSITDSTSLDFDYSLKNPDLVLEYLNESDFDKVEILNFDLIKYISKEKINYFQKAIKLIKRENNILFLVKFLQSDNLDNKTIIPLIVSIWPMCCSETLDDQVVLNKEEQKRFIFTILSYVDSSIVKELNFDNKLKNYLENTEQLYSSLSDDLDLKKIENALSEFNVEIKKFDFNETNEELAIYVYENCLYSLNFENINSAYKKYYHSKKDLMNLSDIYAQDTPLKKYVDLNINTVIDVLKDNLRFNDSEDVTLQILNHEDLNDESAKLYIEKEKCKINKITIVKVALWKLLIQNEKVKYSSDNIVEYFKQFDFDEHVSEFINSDKSVIKLDEDVDEITQKNILNQLLKNNIISTEKIEEFLKSLKVTITKLTLTGIDEEKMKLLIRYSILSFNLENLRFLRSYYSKKNVCFYIENNISAYIEFMNQSNADKDELKFILNSRTISLEDKFKIIKKLPLKLSIIDNQFDDEINKYIIKNHNLYLEEKDRRELILHYSNYEMYSQEIIEMAISLIANIVQKTIPIDKNLRTSLLTSSISESNKKVLLKQSLEIDDLETIKKNLLMMKYNELTKIFEKNKKVNIEKSTEMEELLKLLKQGGFISDFELKDNKYKVIKNKNVSC